MGKRYELHRKETGLVSAWFDQGSVRDLVEVAFLGAKEDDCVGGRGGADLVIEQIGEKIDVSLRPFKNVQSHCSEFQALEDFVHAAQFAKRKVILPKQLSLQLEVKHDQPHRGCGQTFQQTYQTVEQHRLLEVPQLRYDRQSEKRRCVEEHCQPHGRAGVGVCLRLRGPAQKQSSDGIGR